jgi:anti-sigma B factor antagonist
MTDFDCTIERQDGAVLVTPFGDVDRDTAPQLRQALTSAIGEQGAGRVDVELRHVTVMDSSGIGALLAGHRLAAGAGGTLRIRNPTPAVRTVLDLTNVWQLLGA